MHCGPSAALPVASPFPVVLLRPIRHAARVSHTTSLCNASVVSRKFVKEQPQILRLRLPRSAANSAQDDTAILMRT
jgi:hypothetical protein